jgi:hypothetical protein
MNRTMEARGGIEPPIKVLQTFALPLGDRAGGNRVYHSTLSAVDFQHYFCFHSGLVRVLRNGMATGQRLPFPGGLQDVALVKPSR